MMENLNSAFTITLSIVIDPEGEYFTLREKYPVIVATAGKPIGRPKGFKADLTINSETAPVLARRIAEKGYSLILDLRNATMAESYETLEHYTALKPSLTVPSC